MEEQQMGSAYPKALRQRVVDAYMKGGVSKTDVAKRFEVGYATARRWIDAFERTGRLEPKPDSGGRAHQKIFAEHEHALARWLDEDPSLTQLDLAHKLGEEFGLSVCQATVCNALARMGFTIKKNTRR
jgi:transposase